MNQLVMGVLLGSLLLIVCVSVVSRFLHYKSERNLVKPRCECRLCGNVYTDAGGGKVNHCPACNAANLTRGNGKLG